MTGVSAARRRTIQAVKGKDTSIELRVRRVVHELGFRYRLHRADLPGRPDLAFGPRRKAIFVHGCFWHGHACARGARVPAANREYWTTKIARNRARDCRALKELRQMGWRALVLWECRLRNEAVIARRVSAFLSEE